MTIVNRVYEYEEDIIYLMIRSSWWEYSKFPDEQITLDFDDKDELIGIEITGKMATAIKKYYKEK